MEVLLWLGTPQAEELEGRVSEREELDGNTSWLQLRLPQLQPDFDEPQCRAVTWT